MQHETDAIDRRRTGHPVANVAFDEPEAGHIGIGQQPLEFLEVTPVPGREIVEADNPLPCAQQRLDKIGTDEPSGPSDQPDAVAFSESGGNVFV
jgi:hypothetical protein